MQRVIRALGNTECLSVQRAKVIQRRIKKDASIYSQTRGMNCIHIQRRAANASYLSKARRCNRAARMPQVHEPGEQPLSPRAHSRRCLSCPDRYPTTESPQKMNQRISCGVALSGDHVFHFNLEMQKLNSFIWKYINRSTVLLSAYLFTPRRDSLYFERQEIFRCAITTSKI